MRQYLYLGLTLGAMTTNTGLAVEDPREGNFTTSDGLGIHYLDAGQGTPVLLIHSFYTDARWNWVENGVAEALQENNRVVMIDIRGHGESEKPLDPARYGNRLWQDCIELLDHLGIDRTHVHGYSMGGGIVTELMIHAPERILTAGYGGSGVAETDPEWRQRIPPDSEGADPDDEKVWPTLSTDHPVFEVMMSDPDTAAIVTGSGEGRPAPELEQWDVPVLAIVGEFDRPNAKTARMSRELRDFERVTIPAKSHVTAIAPGFIPELYIRSLVEFVNEHDPATTGE